jgi:hypothetical protein
LDVAPSDSWIAMITHWPPRVLREYSLIADGERGAVVGPDGAIVWLCMPRWDSPAVFSALLGRRGGYATTPTDPPLRVGATTSPEPSSGAAAGSAAASLSAGGAGNAHLPAYRRATATGRDPRRSRPAARDTRCPRRFRPPRHARPATLARLVDRPQRIDQDALVRCGACAARRKRQARHDAEPGGRRSSRLHAGAQRQAAWCPPGSGRGMGGNHDGMVRGTA